MDLRFTLFVALRYIRMRLRSTLTILLGVAIGVFVMTVMQSMMFGFQCQAMDTLLTITPGILIKGRPRGALDEGRVYRSGEGTFYVQERLKPAEKEKGVRAWRLVAQKVQSVPGVVAVAPIVQGKAMLRFGSRDRGCNLVGVHAPDYDRVVEFRSKVVGDADDLIRRRDGIILGFLLAEEIGAVIGSRIRVVGTEGSSFNLRVVALWKSGLTTIDRSWAFVNLPVGQALLDFPGATTGFAVKVRNTDEAPAVARAVENTIGLESQSWQEANSNIFAIMRQQNVTTLGTVWMTVLVAGFGIANGLITAVLEKRRDIGILRALGVTRRGITAIFTAEGMIIGILGAVAGLGIASWVIDVMAHTRLPGRGGLSTADTFAMLRGPGIYALSAGVAVVISFVASLFPALRAAKYDPVEIIRTAK